MPRVAVTADLHGNLPDVPECDVLVIAGDVCPDSPNLDLSLSSEAAHWQAWWCDNALRDWLNALDCEVVAIWGNHDFVGESQEPAIREIVESLPWTLLQDSEARVAGLRVWGTPWVPNLLRWAFYASDEALEHRAQLIPAGLDLLVTHGPPYGARDRVSRGWYVGDASINRAIERARPDVTICGHIHEARGAASVSGLPVYNVSAVDETYTLYDTPVQILHTFES